MCAFEFRTYVRWADLDLRRLSFTARGNPWQSRLVESFNRKLRDELPNCEWFRSRAEAKVLIATNLRPRSVEPGRIPIISTRDSLHDWSQNSAAGQGYSQVTWFPSSMC